MLLLPLKLLYRSCTFLVMMERIAHCYYGSFRNQFRYERRLFSKSIFETEINPELSTLPLILLDVDHVVNNPYFDKKHWDDTRMVRVKGWNIGYSPDMVEKFNSFSRTKLAEIRWLTTWDESARTMLAPALGFDEFLLARDPEKDIGKAEAAEKLAQDYPDRPIVWLDDEVGFYTKLTREFWIQRTAKTLLLQPDQMTGLTPKQLDIVETFLKFPSANLQIDLTRHAGF